MCRAGELYKKLERVQQLRQVAVMKFAGGKGSKPKSHVDVYDVYCIPPSSLFRIGQTKPKQYFRAKKGLDVVFRLFHRRRLLSMVIEMGFLTIKG